MLYYSSMYVPRALIEHLLNRHVNYFNVANASAMTTTTRLLNMPTSATSPSASTLTHHALRKARSRTPPIKRSSMMRLPRKKTTHTSIAAYRILSERPMLALCHRDCTSHKLLDLCSYLCVPLGPCVSVHMYSSTYVVFSVACFLFVMSVLLYFFRFWYIPLAAS